MNFHASSVNRIALLWAMTECGLGGFFHAIHSPFTGLLVGGMAVLYISLIALASTPSADSNFFERAKSISSAIGKSLVFVLVVKAVVSPHSPIGAYFAVSLQALIGITVFTLIQRFKLAAFFTALLATTSSALQKVIILVIVFGSPFFEAVDQFVLTTANKMNFLALENTFSASQWIAVGFIGIYAVGGAVIGWFIGQLPELLKKREGDLERVVVAFNPSTQQRLKNQHKKTRLWLFMTITILLTLAFLVEYFFISSQIALVQFARTLVILALWFMLIQPGLRFLINKYSQKGKNEFDQRIHLLREELPQFASFSRFAWKGAATIPGFRIGNFLLLFVYFGLSEN